MGTKLKMGRPTREILEELAVVVSKDPSPDNTFQYAFCLSKSTEPAELRYAVTILDGLVKEGYEHDFDCMYGSATALYLLGDHEESRARCENILRSRPDNRLAREMHLAVQAAQEEREDQQLKKAATVGTVAVAALGVAGVIAGALLSKR